MQRRNFLQVAAAGAAALALRPGAPALSADPEPVLDAHIHLFDPTRPGGVPWPTPDDAAVYKPALPPRYAALSAAFGVRGAIAIEASPLATDNDWLLGVAERHPLMVGIIGDLVPDDPGFRRALDRLHANPLFRGIRYGNLWNRDLAADQHKPGFIEGVRELAAAGLVFESANPDPKLIRALRELGERVPDVTIVIDHLPHGPIPTDATALAAYNADLQALAQRDRVFVKLSEIPVLANGKLITDVSYYRAALDALWDVFGEDRVLFGSDWPNSDHVASYAETFRLVRTYMAEKSPRARAKYFWHNSIAAYHWQPRRPDQRLA
jgi:predicted TIM-barrel fold metal-dependent hydrolase